MTGLKSTLRVVSGLMWMGSACTMLAQAGAAGAAKQGSAAQQTPGAVAKPDVKPAAPMQLQTLGSTGQADPFPPVNPKNFNVDTPSVATVESYLHALLGYAPNRIWRVASIEKTPAPGVSKVVALISERVPNAKVLTAIFFVTPDGKHMIADQSGVQPFSAQPYADTRAILQARADGPTQGASSKDLMLVEFTDLQCPRCKDTQATMARLTQDFPKARIVYENFPLTEIHPFAFQAAAYGVCVAAKNTGAYFTYTQAVYDTQAALTAETGEQTLKNAVVKAGMDPVAIATCASSEATKSKVNASLKLGSDVLVNQTPTLSINGRLVPLTTPYESLKAVIVFQAGLDGVSASAVGPAPSLTGGAGLKPR